jgi:hypothetical protein
LDIAAQAERGEEIKVNGQSVTTIEVTTSATAEEMESEVDAEELAHQQSGSDSSTGGLFDQGEGSL